MTELDPVIHAAARLRVTAVLAALHPSDRLSFARLQRELSMTAGNLSTHLRKLEDAGYVDVHKTHEGRTPMTTLQLTPAGRRAFEEYAATLQALLATGGAAAATPTAAPAAPSGGAA